MTLTLASSIGDRRSPNRWNRQSAIDSGIEKSAIERAVILQILQCRREIWRVSASLVGSIGATAWSVTPKELRARTAAFAEAIAIFCLPLLRRLETRETAQQLMDASSSVGSNHRAAGKARSHAEFAAKIGTVDEEADESVYWLEHLVKCGLVPEAAVSAHLKEARELAAIFAASAKTARLNEEQRKENRRRRPRRRRTD